MTTVKIAVKPTLVTVPSETIMKGWSYKVVNLKTSDIVFNDIEPSKFIELDLDDGNYEVLIAAVDADSNVIGEQLHEKFTIAPDTRIMEGAGAIEVSEVK